VDANKVLAQLLGSGAASSMAGGFAGGLASGLLTSKSGRKLGKKALQVGGLAALAGVAWTAYSRWQEEQRAAASPGRPAADPGRPAAIAEVTAPAAFLPAPGDASAAERLGLVMVRAMIAAAQADGRLDGAERGAIAERIAGLDVSASDRMELLAEIERPVALDALIAEASSPERAVEIYTAARLAVDLDTPAERAWFELLAARLGLAPELVAAIGAQLDAVESGEPR
jgi:uncharacterized membrane protein YebE (DUF533 family)